MENMVVKKNINVYAHEYAYGTWYMVHGIWYMYM